MGLYTLSNREKREVIQQFHQSSPFLTEKLEAKEDISKLSFEGFCSLMNMTLSRDQRLFARMCFSQRCSIAVASHGVGKSVLMACCVCYSVIVTKSMVVCTAPTARQVQNIIFAEVNRLFIKLKRNKLLRTRYGIDLENEFSIGHTFLRELDTKQITQAESFGMWYEKIAMPKMIDISEESDIPVSEGTDINMGMCFGLTSRTSSAFQGLHAKKLILIADELSGIDEEIIQAMESCATGKENRIIGIGNPITRGGSHERLAKEGCFRMTPWTHPNIAPYYKNTGGRWVLEDKSALTDDYEPRINGAITPAWIEQAREKYGENSLFWQTRVLAKFPRLEDMAGAMFTDSLLERATEQLMIPTETLAQLAYLPLYVGCDIGESGDPSVYSFGNWISYKPTRDATPKNILLVRAVVEIESNGADHIQQQRNFDRLKELVASYTSVGAISEKDVFVGTDNTGIGVSLTKDIHVSTSFQCLPCHFKASAVKRKSFTNLRAEVMWSLKTLYEATEVHLYPSVLEEAVDQLNYELTGVRYTLKGSDERIQLIPKEEIIAILGCSPNYADSLGLLAYTAMFFEGEIKDENDKPAKDYLDRDKDKYA